MKKFLRKCFSFLTKIWHQKTTKRIIRKTKRARNKFLRKQQKEMYWNMANIFRCAKDDLVKNGEAHIPISKFSIPDDAVPSFLYYAEEDAKEKELFREKSDDLNKEIRTLYKDYPDIHAFIDLVYKKEMLLTHEFHKDCSVCRGRVSGFILTYPTP